MQHTCLIRAKTRYTTAMEASFSPNDITILTGAAAFIGGTVAMSILSVVKATDLDAKQRSQRIIMIALGEACLLAVTVIVLLLTSF